MSSSAFGPPAPIMNKSTPERKQQPSTAEQRVRDISGCMMWKEYTELERGGLDSIVNHFQTACQEPEFSSMWTAAGFDQAVFHPSTELQRFRPSYEKFSEGLKDLDRAATFGVVFHGTATGNIQTILQNGLDPNRRRGQAYGPGEYFSKEPSVSVSYCRGGLEMVVFVVALPSTVPPPPQDENKKKSATAGTATVLAPRQLYFNTNIPPDMVVVENNNHQIPIGTMKFSTVNALVMRDSQARRAKFLALNREVFQKSQVSKEARLKAEIIQHLIGDKIDLASERFQRYFGTLSELSRREISWYVHQNVDEEVIFFYFADLPEPLGPEEILTTKVQSLDDATKKEEEAKQRLEEERQKDAKHRAPHPPTLPHASTSQTKLEELRQRRALAAQQQHAAASTGSGTTGVFQRPHASTSQTMAPERMQQRLQQQQQQQLQYLAGYNTTGAFQFSGENNPTATNTSAPQPNPTTTLLQCLVAGKVDVASEMWIKSNTCLDDKDKREVAEFVDYQVDKEVRDALFPGLPAGRKHKRDVISIPSPAVVLDGTGSVAQQASGPF